MLFPLLVTKSSLDNRCQWKQLPPQPYKVWHQGRERDWKKDSGKRTKTCSVNTDSVKRWQSLTVFSLNFSPVTLNWPSMDPAFKFKRAQTISPWKKEKKKKDWNGEWIFHPSFTHYKLVLIEHPALVLWMTAMIICQMQLKLPVQRVHKYVNIYLLVLSISLPVLNIKV